MKHSESPFRPTRCTRCGTAFDIAPGVDTECPKCGNIQRMAAKPAWGWNEWGIILGCTMLAGVLLAVRFANQGISAREAGGAAGIAALAGGSLLLWLLFFAVLAVLYFLPSYIASRRNHRNLVALFVANLFLGWTFLGWVGCLIWALVRGSEHEPAVR
jgi:hypothetical protein